MKRSMLETQQLLRDLLLKYGYDDRAAASLAVHLAELRRLCGHYVRVLEKGEAIDDLVKQEKIKSLSQVIAYHASRAAVIFDEGVEYVDKSERPAGEMAVVADEADTNLERVLNALRQEAIRRGILPEDVEEAVEEARGETYDEQYGQQ